MSPENVSHCLHLTKEFRQLSETHTNQPRGQAADQEYNLPRHQDGLSVSNEGVEVCLQA